MTEKLSTEIRKEQLIYGALNVLSREGTKGLSIAGVAKEIGLVPSAVYRHFSSKDQMLQAVIHSIQNRLYGYIREISERTSDPLEQLRRLLFQHTRLIASNQGLPQLIFTEAVFSENRKRRAEAYAFIQGYMKRVANIVRMGQKANRIRPDLRPETVAVMFLGLIQPPAVLTYLSGGDFDITRHERKAWKLFRQMIEN